MTPSLESLDLLTNWDTPTICNAIEITNPERRGFGFTTTPFVSLYPDQKPIIGLAKTVRIRASSPDLSGPAGFAARIPYYDYVHDSPLPTIIVVEDVDPHPGIGAFWGEVHTTLHKALGARGAVTNGSFRDVGDSAPGFQLLGGMVNPSHAFVHPIGHDCPVTVHGMSVQSNDIIHADRHGAVIVPTEAVDKLPAAIDLIARKEAKILDLAKSGDFSLERLKQAIGEMADIH